MSGYNTKQRRALLAFLGEHPDELLTARQMADALAEKQISLSAVYRNLAQLEAEEKVRRSAKSGSHEAFYQYLDAKGCKGALHMSCVKCGKTFHMAESTARTSKYSFPAGFGRTWQRTLYILCRRSSSSRREGERRTAISSRSASCTRCSQA